MNHPFGKLFNVKIDKNIPSGVEYLTSPPFSSESVLHFHSKEDLKQFMVKANKILKDLNNE